MVAVKCWNWPTKISTPPLQSISPWWKCNLSVSCGQDLKSLRLKGRNSGRSWTRALTKSPLRWARISAWIIPQTPADKFRRGSYVPANYRQYLRRVAEKTGRIHWKVLLQRFASCENSRSTCARNVRLYHPYRQYTNFFIFRFVNYLYWYVTQDSAMWFYWIYD